MLTSPAVAFDKVAQELDRMRLMFPPYNSAHEGYAVILEELDELWDEVRKREPDRELMRKEAAQVAATAIRFLIDVCRVATKGRPPVENLSADVDVETSALGKAFAGERAKWEGRLSHAGLIEASLRKRIAELEAKAANDHARAHGMGQEDGLREAIRILSRNTVGSEGGSRTNQYANPPKRGTAAPVSEQSAVAGLLAEIERIATERDGPDEAENPSEKGGTP